MLILTRTPPAACPPVASRAPRRSLWLASALLLCSCAGTPGGTVGAGDGGGGADGTTGGFWTNPALCDPALGLRSALRAGPLVVGVPAAIAEADAVADALVVAGYAGVTRTDDLGLVGGVAAADARGDLVIWPGDGGLVVASSCELDSLGQVHRLDDALLAFTGAVAAVENQAITVAAKLPLPSHAAQTLRWARPAGVYGDVSGRYWRHYVGDGLDRNPPTSGALAMGAASGAVGFAVAGASDPGGDVGDVVGVESLTIDGVVVAEQDKRVVRGAATLRWQVVAGLGIGEHSVDLDLIVADASLRWKTGTWTAYVEALFDKDGSLTLSLQGAGAGTLRVSRAISELDLPSALTAVNAAQP